MELVRLLALVNFIVQIALMGVVVYAGYLAGKRNLRKHCTVMRIAVALQILATIAVMGPSFLGHTVNHGALPPWFFAEIVTHAVMGLAIIGIWVFVNLARTGVIKVRWRLQGIMRVAFFLWSAVFAIGMHMYLLLWVF